MEVGGNLGSSCLATAPYPRLGSARLLDSAGVGAILAARLQMPLLFGGCQVAIRKAQGQPRAELRAADAQEQTLSRTLLPSAAALAQAGAQPRSRDYAPKAGSLGYAQSPFPPTPSRLNKQCQGGEQGSPCPRPKCARLGALPSD